MKKWIKIALLLLLLAALAAGGWEAYERTKPEVTFIPHELNEETQVLRGDLIVKLGWQHRREKQVRLNMGSGEDPMFYAGDRTYVETLELSMHERKSLIVHLWEDGKAPTYLCGRLTSQLLPIGIHSWSRLAPGYADGVLNLGNSFSFTALGQDGPGRWVDAPGFHFYRNGEEVCTLDGVRFGQKQYLEYHTSGTEDVCIPCEAGDEVTITFSGKDGYGLGYEFALVAYAITEQGFEERVRELEWYPVLSWN